ncbi:hypothetical protein AGMMS49950_09850 [Endomicrobiia bacterium]|nr:hypothetical protein AGMMS49950_09850 [Endomicrobiia bacterium]
MYKVDDIFILRAKNKDKSGKIVLITIGVNYNNVMFCIGNVISFLYRV